MTGNARREHLGRMSRKTISIDDDAYDILVKAKDSPRMSFSDAIRRVKEMPRVRTFADLVKYEDELFPLRKARAHERKAAVAR